MPEPILFSSGIRSQCREILITEACRYKVDPALVVAHVRYPRASAARKAVQLRMMEELGMKRHQIAKMFGRDLRRVRASVMNRPVRLVHRTIPTYPALLDGDQLVWQFKISVKRRAAPRALTGR